jgi:transcriptional regulator with XRE-family HTH domain
VGSIHTPAYRRLVQRLREARVKAGLTQVEVAKRLKRPQSYVSSCEEGQHRIDVIELFQFAKLYGVKVNYFLNVLDND